jgi:hypothetical protein
MGRIEWVMTRFSNLEMDDMRLIEGTLMQRKKGGNRRPSEVEL